jgi:hypothetical protein
VLCTQCRRRYVASIFLWKIRAGFARAAESGRVSNSSGGTSPPFSHLNSYSWFVVPADSIAGRIRSLFYIALGNFIFPSTSSCFILRPTGYLISAPVIFNIVLLVIVWDDRINKINVIYVTPINLYVTIFGVVFATGTSSYASTTCPQLTSRSMELILRSHAQRWNSSARARDPATAAAAFCSH